MLNVLSCLLSEMSRLPIFVCYCRLDSRLHKIIEEAISDYSNTINMGGEHSDVEFVCQKCPEHTISTTFEELAKHIKVEHISDLNIMHATKRFIKDHVTFEEKLTLEDSTEIDSIKQSSERVLRSFCCPFCASVFSSTIRLSHHISQHVEVNINVGIICCEVQYTERESFFKHLQESHVICRENNVNNICRTCGFSADSHNALQTHIVGEHANDQDRKKGKDISKLPKDSTRNQKYIPVTCPKCRKVFSNKYHMLIHLKSHSEISRYICELCEKTYSNASNLSKHKKLVHQGILSFVCQFCGEAFPSRQTRDTHSRIHSGDAPFHCDYCTKNFRSKQTLQRHIEMHLDIRKYACHFCPKKFRKGSHLIYHISTHERK